LVSNADKSHNPPTLFDWVRQNLSSLDHVGSTLHFEGYNSNKVAELVRASLSRLGLTYREEAIPKERGTTYTFLSSIKTDRQVFLWVTINDDGGLITVVETRVVHTTEDSAFADEFLAEFTSTLQEPNTREP